MGDETLLVPESVLRDQAAILLPTGDLDPKHSILPFDVKWMRGRTPHGVTKPLSVPH
jgi:hypothetical protein